MLYSTTNLNTRTDQVTTTTPNRMQTVTSHRKTPSRGITGGEGEGPSRNMYIGHMDKAKGGRFEVGRWGWVGWGGVGDENGDNCTE